MNDKNQNFDDDNFGSYQDYDINPDSQSEHTPLEESNDYGDDEDFEYDENDMSKPRDDYKDEEKQAKDIENKANPFNKFKNLLNGKGGAKSGTKQGAKTGKAMVHVIKFLFTPPVLWFTLAIIGILLILAFIMIAFTMASGAAGGAEANMDPANGVFGTSLGITGEQFYGGRFIYLDPEKSQQDLKDYYYAFSEDFLDAIDNMQNVDLNVSIDLENTNKELSTIIAKTVSASEESLTLEEYIALVDHFGYTNVELDTIQEGFVDYVIDNQETLLTINDGYSSLETDLNTLYDDLFVAYNVTAPLYYVKDVILEGPEAMIPSQDPKNYVAFIYMPRTDVYLVSSSFSFYFPEENGEVNEIYTKQPYATNVLFEYITVHNGEEVTYYNATADSSWWKDGTAQQLAEVNYTPVEGSPLPKFTSIDESNPIIDKSLYSTLFDDKENASTHNVKKYFTANQIQQGDLDYYEISYLPHNDGTYFYIRLTADGIFQYCEYEAEFVTKTN